jgi:hypothetical protein
MKRENIQNRFHTAPSEVSLAPSPNSKRAGTIVIVYDTFEKPGGYTLADYYDKWSTSRGGGHAFGLGEMDLEDTRRFDDGTFSISATPFRTAADAGVSDHSKYLGASTQEFAVPAIGSITFSINIAVETPGTIEGHIVHGTYVESGAPYVARVLQGQQAAASLHMINFATGQVFDWFVSGNTAFTFIERVPSSVTGSRDYVGKDKMYTQIIDEVPIEPGVAHTVAIRFTRDRQRSLVEYFLDGKRVSKVDRVGIPLDAQSVKYTGLYPSLGAGEVLSKEINSLLFGHGLVSLLDPFPFQDPEAPALNVSISLKERLFGQGAKARFANAVITIDDKTKR